MATQVRATKTTLIPRQPEALRPAKAAPPERAWIIRRARRRIASGFYDSPECLDAAIELLLETSKRRSKRAGRDAAGRS